MYEKRKALTHEYPSKHNEFEKWGFDPKQLHHIKRLNELIYVNITGDYHLSFLEYDEDTNRDLMIDLKRNKSNITKEEAEMLADILIEETKALLPVDYKYEPINIDNEISYYIETKIKLELCNTETTSAREYRTFDNPIPKKDLERFPILEKYKGQDVSYIIYESISIL